MKVTNSGAKKLKNSHKNIIRWKTSIKPKQGVVHNNVFYPKVLPLGGNFAKFVVFQLKILYLSYKCNSYCRTQ